MPTGRKGIDIMKNIKIIKAKYIVESDRRKGKAVMCLDTGEVFTSAKECADMKHLSYVSFTQILNKGKVAKDGHLYCYVADMAYYADAIQDRIYRKAKMEYDAMKLQLAEIEHKKAKLCAEMGKFENIKED